MKKQTIHLVSACLLVFVLICLNSCNPDCTSLAGLRLSSDFNVAGYEVLITANPPESLKNRKVFFGNEEATEVRFVDGQGLAVRVPENLQVGATELRIQDLDCTDIIALEFEVKPDDFFFNNESYVFPPLPEIIIPNLPVTDFPPSIENAWLSVNNLDYCMWFKFMKEVASNGDTVCTTNIDPARSFEQCFAGCLGFTNDADCLYDDNPLSGIIDPANNFVRVIVDRTRWGGGYEEFTGQFINPSEAGIYEEWEAGDEPTNVAGLPINTTRDHMILLTSQLNGRKVLIYQQGLNVAASTTDCN